MYVTIRKTELSGTPDAAAQRMRDHLLPLVQGRPGLHGYCAFADEEEGTAYFLGIFRDRESAMAVDDRVAQWIGDQMGGIIPEAGRVIGGETVFHDVAQPQEQQKERQQSLFATVRIYHGLPGQTETMHSLVSEHTLPTITRAQGFRGFYAFRDEQDTDRALSVTLFDRREDAMRSHEEVLGIMQAQLGELAYQVPRLVSGETLILATG